MKFGRRIQRPRASCLLRQVAGVGGWRFWPSAAGATGRAARVGFDGDGFALAMEGGYWLLRSLFTALESYGIGNWQTFHWEVGRVTLQKFVDLFVCSRRNCGG